jgi:hypothetical protein
MIADTGEIRKVNGKRIEMVPIGPIPGRTPIKVPTSTPKKQNNKLVGSIPTEKP